MARCIVSTYIDHDYLERLEAEATRRGLTRAALAREVIQAAFPPAAQDDEGEGTERGESE